MSFSIPTLVAQSASAIYGPCKDVFLYFKDERQHISDIEDRISDLITKVALIKSEKAKIDRCLKYSVSMEKNVAYLAMEARIAIIYNKYIKFIENYTKITKNALSSPTEQNVSIESLMISELGNLKSRIWTSNFWKLAKLSRDITKLCMRASEFLDELKSHNMLKNSKPNLEKLDDKNNLPVFDEYVYEVLDCLCEMGSIVGIVGPMGVGKTTVLRKLYNELIERKSLVPGDNSSQLEFVIFTEYPQELEAKEMIVQKLQSEIMEQLNIAHEATTTSIQKNGNAISMFLSGKKYILLMDHVPFEIDLGSLGLKEHHKYKKVVIASRNIKAINRMTDHVVEIHKLEENDARMLFLIAFGKIIDSRKRDIADMIIECCGGIPWMIYHVAKYLSSRPQDSSWYHIKNCLQSESKQLISMGLGGMDNVYKMMYEELEIVNKKCLLYGALFPNHYKIYRDYLIECWIAEGFLDKGGAMKIRQGRDYGQEILDQLTDWHLLNWSSDQMYIQMPLSFRRVALELDYPDSTNCVICFPSNDLEPGSKLWCGVTRMSLISCETQLPESPECDNICTLLLQSLKPEVEQLPQMFFLHMCNLQILDLSRTNIRALPNSIDSLVKLKSLYLNDCNRLEGLPSQAAKLEKLEILDISNTSISSLPQEIRCMLNLRCLRASCSELIIPPGIISKLRKLEELSIVATFDHKRGASMAEELASLKHLNTLCFNFPNVSSVDTFMNESISLKNITTSWKTHTLRSYKVFIGRRHETRHHPYESVFSGMLAERWLTYSADETFSPACQELLKQASAFELIGYKSQNEKSLSHFDMNSVKVCVVASCVKLKHIIDGYINSEKQGIVKQISPTWDLKKLYLYDLQSLERIRNGVDHFKSLSNLTTMTINSCPMLTKIIDPALAQTLQSLKYLKVENCSEVTEIIEFEQGDPSDILTSLRIIELTELPKLQSICKSSSMSWKSLTSIIIIRCAELRNLSLTCANAKKLALIQCEKNLWDSLMLPDELSERLRPFCHFKEESASEPEPGPMEKHKQVEGHALIGHQAPVA